MSIPTDRELEFLARLSTNWRRLYRNELALLLTVRPGKTADTLPYRMAGALDAQARAKARHRMTIVVD